MSPLTAVLVTIVASASWALPAQGATNGAATLRAPLAAGLTTTGGSWAVVPMGQLSQPLNTFWQVFFRAGGTSKWKLVTPPGVADNGGLTLSAPSDASVSVGFLPSQKLEYSPLALSQNDGAAWSAALVPTSLVALPDALATDGARGRALALVRSRRTPVLSSSGGLLKWSSASGGGDLALGANGSCAIAALTAVSFGPNAQAMVGARCRRPGVVGVFSQVAGRWRLSGPVLSGPLSRATTSVMRLDPSAGGLAALVGTTTSARRSLVAIWGAADGSWSESEPLAVQADQRITSSAVGIDGEQAVLLSSAQGGSVLEVATGAGQSWTKVASPPSGTVTVAVSVDGSIDAFAVNGESLAISTLTPGQPTWTPAQKLTVPLSYGSS